MRVYLMRFDSQDGLNHAFGLLMDAAAVESSLVGPSPLELRFMARRPDAESLIQRIYGRGGLTWCTSYDAQTPVRVVEPGGAGESPAEAPDNLG